MISLKDGQPSTQMDIQAMQSMDWLFKKEKMYLLAQFWHQRATLAEKEVSALKEQLAATSRHHGSGTSGAAAANDQRVSSNSDDLGHHRPSLEIELSAKDKEISQLVEDVHKLQSSMGKLQETTASQISKLEEELNHRRQHILRLEARLEAQKDYEELKRQLVTMRSSDKRSDNEDDSSAERLKSENQSPKYGRSESPLSENRTEGNQSSVAEQGSSFPSSSLQQNVEQFGSFLGEEIVSNWRRSLEKSIISQSSSSSTPPPATLVPTIPLPTSRSFYLSTPPPTLPVSRSSPHSDKKMDIQDSADSIEEIGRGKRSSVDRDTDIGDTTPKSARESNSPTPSLDNQTHRSEVETPSKSPASSIEQETMSSHNSPSLGIGPGIGGPTHGIPSGLINGFCGLNVGLNNNIPMNFELLKSQFRFEDPRPFRFGDESGAMIGRFGESLIPKGDPMEARLQEMLRYNMDKYSTQNLDTLTIARRVRELLSIHNVGQRLFAKYVLGLSQGTVSELLSKPKPWDKLTEKGRDSYRKMHAWACDENAVLLLKSLIPKKGKEAGIPSMFVRGEGDMNDDRITHILNEANQMMKPAQIADSDNRSNEDSKSPNHGQSPSPIGREGFGGRKLRKYEDELSQDQVIRIYQEELAKLMGRRLDEHPFPGFMFPPFFGAGAAGGNPEEIRAALDVYHRELAKLQNCPPNQTPHSMSGFFGLHQQNPLTAGGIQQPPMSSGSIIQDLSLPKGERKHEKLPNGELDRNEFKKDHNSNNSDSNSDSLKPSAFSLVRPKPDTGITSTNSSPLGNSILPPEDFSPSASVSPLQRMASITNSLISQPPTTHHHSPSQRPLKAVLPPITQQQFDQFNNLNTEEIVRKVKEQLSQFSISQRLFGESVLGLSQGSVSDLLARPKPWHMLTQKGREPFIRMKMFLEDDNAVHKLVASQYKIAPEKLMRTGGYGGGPPINSSLSKSMQQSMKGPSSVDHHKSENGPDRTNLPLHPNFLHHPGHVHPPSASPIFPNSSHHVSAMEHFKKSFALPPTNHQAYNIMSQQQHTQQQQQSQQHVNALRSMGQHISPSVYEMAALTQELDTQAITTKIKEALLANNIGQKIFGEVVLGLSQGSVSELLSKPKPWHMLSIKGREPFIRMQLWLSDSHNIERLQALKTERREMNKRRRGSGGQDNSSDTSSNDTSEFYGSSASSPPSAAKKQRVLFSDEQKEALRLAFTLDPYPSVPTIEFLATELGLSSRTITNWFHNHRMRLKQQPGSDAQMSRENQGNSFDPVQFRFLLSQRLSFSALSLPFPGPYFPPNPEFAALMSRNMLSAGEQMSGLDLSLKRDTNSDDDEDDEMDNESHLSDDSDTPPPEVPHVESRSSRRKPAAPQWVNPDWQEESEVIINGVCVMPSDEYPTENDQERPMAVKQEKSRDDENESNEDETEIMDESSVSKIIEPIEETKPVSPQSEDCEDGRSEKSVKQETNWEDEY